MIAHYEVNDKTDILINVTSNNKLNSSSIDCSIVKFIHIGNYEIHIEFSHDDEELVNTFIKKVEQFEQMSLNIIIMTNGIRTESHLYYNCIIENFDKTNLIFRLKYE